MENVIKDIFNSENIPFDNIEKATSGFTNLVYFVDDKYVIKMSKDKSIKQKLDKEISIYKNIIIDCIPKYIASGMIEDYKYLIITKVRGKSLYSIWHTLTQDERRIVVKQIANILKQFNGADYNFLNSEYVDFDWVDYMKKELSTKVVVLSEIMGLNAQNVDNFIKNDLERLFGENEFSLVYNDAHFDNFIYDNGRLSLIDFDRVRVCPIDYEMLIFKTMCDNPSKFASEADEDKIKDEDYIGIYEQFKVEYPEIFKNKDVEKRIAVYQFNYLMGQAIKCKNHKWANELLEKFNNLIDNERKRYFE